VDLRHFPDDQTPGNVGQATNFLGHPFKKYLQAVTLNRVRSTGQYYRLTPGRTVEYVTGEPRAKTRSAVVLSGIPAWSFSAMNNSSLRSTILGVSRITSFGRCGGPNPGTSKSQCSLPEYWSEYLELVSLAIVGSRLSLTNCQNRAPNEKISA